MWKFIERLLRSSGKLRVARGAPAARRCAARSLSRPSPLGPRTATQLSFVRRQSTVNLGGEWSLRSSTTRKRRANCKHDALSTRRFRSRHNLDPATYSRLVSCCAKLVDDLKVWIEERNCTSNTSKCHLRRTITGVVMASECRWSQRAEYSLTFSIVQNGFCPVGKVTEATKSTYGYQYP